MGEIFKSSELGIAIGAIATGFIGYIAGKKKNAAEVEGIEVNNDKEIFSTYKNELEYFRNQLETTRKEISTLRNQLDRLINSNCANVDCPLRVKIKE